MSRFAAAAAALVACMALAVPASAARTEVFRGPGYAPQLIDGGAIYLRSTSAGVEVNRAVPGQPPLTLTTLGHPPVVEDCCDVNHALQISADGGYVAAARWVQVFAKGAEAENSFRIVAGPANAPLPALHGCSGNAPIDVDGTRIAYINRCAEAGGAPPIVVRDLAEQGAPVVAGVTGIANVSRLDLAGQHLAIERSSSPNATAANTEVGVRDLAQPTDAYTVAGRPYVFSLQSDGKLATARIDPDGPAGCRIEWYSKAEPTAHVIDVCPIGGVRLANDRVLVVRDVPNGSSLDLFGLGGGTTQVAGFAKLSLIQGSDFDGTRVAYGVAGCSDAGDAVYVDDLAGGAPPAEGGACPAAIPKKEVRASSSGLVRVGFSCAAGCEGSFTLQRGGVGIVKAGVTVGQKPGSGRATMRLTGATRRLLRQRGTLAVQARFRVDQRSGSAITVKRSIRLLAPR